MRSPKYSFRISWRVIVSPNPRYLQVSSTFNKAFSSIIIQISFSYIFILDHMVAKPCLLQIEIFGPSLMPLSKSCCIIGICLSFQYIFLFIIWKLRNSPNALSPQNPGKNWKFCRKNKKREI